MKYDSAKEVGSEHAFAFCEAEGGAQITAGDAGLRLVATEHQVAWAEKIREHVKGFRWRKSRTATPPSAGKVDAADAESDIRAFREEGMSLQQGMTEFRHQFRGTVLEPGDEGYEMALKVYNAVIKPLHHTLVSEFARSGSSFVIQQRSENGEHAYTGWAADTADNSYRLVTETFMVRNGRIIARSFAARILRKS